uniref:Uncharacterized protein n=1 Tax=Plectus sambesii TaxID=2011161 RepID=A0A914VYJ7_9BILA
MLVMVVCTYLIANILNVLITFLEFFDMDGLKTNYAGFYTFSVDIVSLLTVVASALRLPIYCACQAEIRDHVIGVFFHEDCCSSLSGIASRRGSKHRCHRLSKDDGTTQPKTMLQSYRRPSSTHATLIPNITENGTQSPLAVRLSLVQDAETPKNDSYLLRSGVVDSNGVIKARDSMQMGAGRDDGQLKGNIFQNFIVEVLPSAALKQIMKSYALVVALFVFLACQAEGKRRRHDTSPPGPEVICIRECFHKMVDGLGTINMTSPVQLYFGKKKDGKPSQFTSDQDAFKAVCSYHKETLQSCVEPCKLPEDKHQKKRIEREMHILHTLDATCVKYYDELIANWDCIIKLKSAAETNEECQKCDKSCNVICYEDCVRPLAKETCGSEAPADVMTKLAVHFTYPGIERLVKKSENEEYKAKLDQEVVDCLEDHKKFVEKYKNDH